jgi:hypothetical protein
MIVSQAAELTTVIIQNILLTLDFFEYNILNDSL